LSKWKPATHRLLEMRSQLLRAVHSESRLKVAFVGAGQHARTNLYPCLPHVPVDLMAICARRKASAEAAARAFGAPSAYDDFEAMFDAERLDAVFVCVSASEHARIARAALERGLHVFLEKPATRTLDEAEALREHEKKAGRHVMVGLQKRHAPAYRKARELMSAAPFGPMSAIDARFGVGAFMGEEAFLLEVALHHLDLIRFFGGDVSAIHAERHRARSDAFTLAVVLRFESGAVGTLRLSTEQSWRAHNERVELTGDGQSLVIDNMLSLRHYKTVDAPSPGGPFAGPGEAFWEPNFTVPTLHNQTLYLNGFGYEVEHFVRCIQSLQKPTPDLQEFCQDLRLVEALTSGHPLKRGAR
jgi:predicted dehydrogenase